MTKQEIFDDVVTHLANQKKRSSEGGYCRYRGPDGLKCAAGIFIKDEDYQTSFEGKRIASLIERRLELRGGAEEHPFLLYDLQDAHDFNFEPKKMRKELVAIAIKNGVLDDSKVSLITEWEGISYAPD